MAVAFRRAAALPGWRAVAAAGLCGALAATGQAPWGLWPLALAGLAGACALVGAAPGGRAAAWRGWAAGTGHFAVALHWIVEPFLIEPDRHGWMAPFALVLMAGGLALFWAAAGWVTGRWRLGPVGFAVALAGAEAARGVAFTGFPWALPGHVWIGTPVAQVAAWGGAGLLTLATLLVAALPAASPRRGGVVAVAMLAVLWGAGAWRTAAPLPPAPGPVVRVVQPDAKQGLKWDPAWSDVYFARQLAATAAQPGPDLIVWPETAVDFLLDRPGDGLALIAAAAQGVPVAFGVQRTDGWRAYNTLALMTGGGQVTAIYDKHHLVPFGEYLPGGDLLFALFGIAAFAAQEGQGYSAGPGPSTMTAAGVGTVVPLICYEAVFPRLIRRAMAGSHDAPAAILQVTNDAWFGAISGPYQHLALARLRAIEFGLPVVRAANTGVSAVIDARGRIVTSLALNTHGHADAALPAALPPTPYARLGEAPFLLLLSLSAAAVLWHRRRRAIDRTASGA